MTFSRAMGHATNFTSGHESRTHMIGAERLAYPDWHIESDNRLAWFLGSLDKRYGHDPEKVVWVHLQRDPVSTAQSYARRRDSLKQILPSFGYGILSFDGTYSPEEWERISLMYVQTVTDNISQFLSGRSNVVEMRLEDPVPSMEVIWDLAEIHGDFGEASREWLKASNESTHRKVDIALRRYGQERDAAIAERDAAIAERDAAIAERDEIKERTRKSHPSLDGWRRAGARALRRLSFSRKI